MSNNNVKKLNFDYDEASDVLYAFVGDFKDTINKEKGDGITIRIDPQTKNPIGFIIIDYKKRLEKKILKTVPSFENIALPIY